MNPYTSGGSAANPFGGGGVGGGGGYEQQTGGYAGGYGQTTNPYAQTNPYGQSDYDDQGGLNMGASSTGGAPRPYGVAARPRVDIEAEGEVDPNL